MPRLSFLFRTDVHLADKSPVSWKGDYMEEILSDLDQIGKLAKLHDVTAVLDGGDYFHVKSSSKNPHYLNEKSANLHKLYPCPVYGVVGNHDMVYNSLESVPTQPLGVLHATGVIRDLHEEVFVDGSIQVRVVGVPYSPNRTLEELLAIRKKPGDTHLIAIVHSLASLKPPGSVADFWNEPVFSYESLITKNGPDCWNFGHWHKDQGIEVIEGRYFVNQGAVSRGALVRENLERVPKVALLDFDGGTLSVTPIPLSVAPASDVFDLEKKELQEKERKDLDQFVLRLVSDGELDPDASIEDNIQGLEFASAVRSEALRYLELVEANL